MMRQGHGFGTRSVHAGEALDPTTGAFGVPISQNTTASSRSDDPSAGSGAAADLGAEFVRALALLDAS